MKAGMHLDRGLRGDFSQQLLSFLRVKEPGIQDEPIQENTAVRHVQVGPVWTSKVGDYGEELQNIEWVYPVLSSELKRFNNQMSSS